MALDSDDPTLFSVADAHTAGIGRRQLARAAEKGTLRRWARGVYGERTEPDSIDTRARAVSMLVSPAHVIADRTAAWLHGVDTFVLSEHDLLPPIETCVLRGHNPSRRAEETTARTRDLLPSDVMSVGGLRVTTPLRTALDLSCHLRRREAFAAMCQLAGGNGFDRRDLERQLPRFRGRRGVVQSRGLVPLVEPRVESAREAWTLLEIATAGLPLPVAQHWVEVDGVASYRLDFAYPFARVAVEYDGAEAHGTAQQRTADAERLAVLNELGWVVLVVRRGDFTPDAIDRWTRELRDALRPRYSNRRWRF